MQNQLFSQIIEKEYPKAPSVRMIKIKYGLVFLILSLAAGCISFFSFKADFSLNWLKLAQLLAMCLLGLIHVQKIHHYNLQTEEESIGIKHPIQVSFLILILLAVLYYFLSPDILLMAPGSACAFLLPHMIYQSWLIFSEISQTGYGVWAKPLPDTKEKTFIFFGGLPVKLKFSIEGNDKNKKLFKSYAPPDKSIGDFFNHFLLIQRNNNKLELDLLDEEQKPFGWKFFRTEYMGLIKKQLDPNENFEELKLKSTETILATRVRLANQENVA